MQAVKKNDKRMIFVIAAIVIALALILYMSGVFGGRARRVSAWQLRCIASQQPTPFGDRVLYYDGTTLFCLSASGSEVWSYALGSGAGFDAEDRHVVAWAGANLHILDRNGRATYNDRLADDIQFARVGPRYVAAVIGPNVSPTLIIKDMSGLGVDSETLSYTGRVILDMGFFENGQYIWVTSLDVYGVVPGTAMNIYGVGATNTGTVELGEELSYKVLYSNGLLNVVNTREVNLYDYRGLPKDAGTRRLVYGWRLIDWGVGEGDAKMLFAPVFQTGFEPQITELRVLWGSRNSRYTLPDTCVGATLRGNTLYAFSADSLYRADMNARRFTAARLPSPIDQPVTGYIGKLSNGVALVHCGQDVFAVTLP